MVYGAIAEGGGKYYTCLSEVFAAAGSIEKDHNWLITDWTAYGAYGIGELEELESETCWLTGGELAALLGKYREYQWIWGVLSGFATDIPKEEVLKYPMPYADGYEGFWRNPLSLQHPLADIEIVPWDSTLVLVLAKDRKIVEEFRKNFLPSRDLYQYNEDLCKECGM